MSENIQEAVTIALAGMATVLVALTILMTAITLLSRLSSRERGQRQMKNSVPEVTQGRSPGNESIAAVAVAMALAMEEERTADSIGYHQAPASGPAVTRWAAAGRERLMGSRTKTGHEWRKG